ncbi:hypothetical protein AMTRI_Chr02g256600 [Amborella trichopoda]
MVYSGAVDRIIGRPPPTTGDVVFVTDGTQKPIGWGLYISVFMFCVCLMQLEEDARRDSSSILNMEKLLETRIDDAIDLRRRIGLPSGVLENGIHYQVLLDGQKTGFYADQRESRLFISSISKGSKVLDVCCYTGGLVYMQHMEVLLRLLVCIDSSSSALETAKENVLLNNMDPNRISFLKEDVSEFMKNAASRGEAWDHVILDPPKLAPCHKVLQRATGMYRNLNSLALRITKRGGLLMTCSCSGAMTEWNFPTQSSGKVRMNTPAYPNGFLELELLNILISSLPQYA